MGLPLFFSLRSRPLSATTVEITEYCDAHSCDITSSDLSHPRLSGHDPKWVQSISQGLNYKLFLLQSGPSVSPSGRLPLALVSGPIFGKFLVSLPYVNTGGVFASTPEIASELVDTACDLADRLKVRYLELRHEVPVDHPRLNHQRTDKSHMRLELPDTDAELDKSFKSKLRSQIKKCGTYNHKTTWGGMEMLPDFYRVFATNMRDLGTPVFSRKLFESIIRTFEGSAEFCVLHNDNTPVAAALLVHSEGSTEVPSASSLRKWNRMGPNMWMYRKLLARAIERKSHTFDFGRSTISSSTYKFKKQWGATAYPAVWQYYVREGNVEQMRPESQTNQKLIKLWQKLPTCLTNVIGPPIVRGIP